MLAAILLRVAGMSEDFEFENKGAFDVILLLTQGLAPTVLVAMVLMKGKDVTARAGRKVTKSLSGVWQGEESGLELGVVGGTGLGGVKRPFTEEERDKMRLKQLGSFGPPKGGGKGRGRRGEKDSVGAQSGNVKAQESSVSPPPPVLDLRRSMAPPPPRRDTAVVPPAILPLP
ncbi:hypothetical protein TrLO_g13551 [Triparma laevis f. longispina]|uniref:Uncharacterized protein n=1 Tax=Triparma laevis f. longispina TaxID=1714387 RepID=A0A9W7C190_9STRA|nr:hypothetical protein TrLO_g13551 [Triparma laevis f. longispina]